MTGGGLPAAPPTGQSVASGQAAASMSLEVKDDSSKVKLKLRSMFLNKAADHLKSKGCSDETAEAKARATELQLYRNSKDKAEYKEKAVKVMTNLKKQEADAVEHSRPSDPDDSPAAKKQKVEGGGSEAAANDTGAEGDAASADSAASKPESAKLVLTGDKTRDKVRTRIAEALKLVPERDRTAINKVRSSMEKGPLCEFEVAAAVEEEMHRVLTGAPKPSVLLRRHAPVHMPQLTASGAQSPRRTSFRHGISLRISALRTIRPFDCAC